jgi:hypothetical protein
LLFAGICLLLRTLVCCQGTATTLVLWNDQGVSECMQQADADLQGIPLECAGGAAEQQA